MMKLSSKMAAALELLRGRWFTRTDFLRACNDVGMTRGGSGVLFNATRRLRNLVRSGRLNVRSEIGEPTRYRVLERR